TFFGGHLVPDFEGLVNNGLDFYEKEIERCEALHGEESKEFFSAMRIILDCFRTIILRTADACADKAKECDGKECENMLVLASELRTIAHNKPQTFRQAVELVWFLHICNNADSFGRFDKYLYPFYEADIAFGRITKQQVLLILQSLMIKIDEQNQIQNMTIGGILADGAPCYNELTQLILEAVRTMGYKGPNLAMRVSRNMPEKFWDEIHKTLATGQGLPALYNDEVMLDYVTKFGIAKSDCYDFCLAGCSQIMIPGKSQFANDIGIMNVLKIVELALYNGYDAAMTGVKVGPQTGTPDKLDTFDKFMNAFYKQMNYCAQVEADVNNKIVKMFGEREGYALRTLFTKNCLEKALGVYCGGAEYNSIQLECIGITNAANSLIAIKKAVYEDKILTLSQLAEVLKSNYKDNEELKNYFKNNIPKFGNDESEVDALRAEITNHLFSKLREQKSVIGGIYIPGEVIFTTHEWQGRICGATPDGRLAGEVLADSAGASQGTDKKGPTALLNSVLKVAPKDICTSIVLNLKFLKSFWNDSAEKIIILFKVYFEQGGQQLQINVCDAELLKKAYDNPEAYPNLIVRVGGYSAYFNTLSRALQKEILERTQQMV
ncbi:MAG: pyruvate formate lyase family protein, partial [Acutalibacteraceae bacterium]